MLQVSYVPEVQRLQAELGGVPETGGPRVVLLHHRPYPPGSLVFEPRFRFRDQTPGDPLAPVIRVHRQPVDIAPPTVEGRDDLANDNAGVLG